MTNRSSRDPEKQEYAFCRWIRESLCHESERLIIFKFSYELELIYRICLYLKETIMQFENVTDKNVDSSRQAPAEIKCAGNMPEIAEQGGERSIYDFADLWIARDQPPYLV